jgi:signal peptidase II
MKHRTLIIGILLTVAILDGALKYFAITAFPPENDPALSPVFAFALHKNPGITFDIPIPFWIIAPATVLIISVLTHQARTLFHTQNHVALGIIAVIIGAVGNFVDRAINGFTTDYLMFFKTSIINLSDVMIILGAIMILVYYTNNPHQRRA